MPRAMCLKDIILVATLVLLGIGPVSTRASSVLSGRDLLKARREKWGQARKPAYEDRTKGPASDELLRAIPAESLFCVRVNNLERTLNQADQFLAGVLPLPMDLSELVCGQIATLLGSPRPSGVNMRGNIALFGTLISTEAGAQQNPHQLLQNLHIVLLLPVTDYEQFVKDNPNLGSPNKKGVSEVKSSGMRGLTPLVTNAGSFAMFSLPQYYDPECSDQLLSMAASIRSESGRGLAATVGVRDAEKAVTEPIWLHINVELAGDSNIPIVIQEVATGSTGQMMSPAPEGAAPLQMCVLPTGFEKRMNEIRSVILTARPAPHTLTVGCTISAKPGTATAEMFTADSQKLRELAAEVGAERPKQMGPELNAICQLLPQAAEADFVGTYDLTGLSTLSAGLIPVQVPEPGGGAKSSLAFSMKAGGGKMNLDLAVPKQHLTEVLAMSEGLGEEGPDGPEMAEFDLPGTDSGAPAQKVKLIIVGAMSDAAAAAIREKLIEIIDDPAYYVSSSASLSGDEMTVQLSPVRNLEAFAKKINFGKVTDTDAEGRTIWVELTEAPLGEDEGAETLTVAAQDQKGPVTARLRKVDFPQMYGRVHGGYQIPLVLKLPVRAVSLGEGEIETAATTLGQSLLPKQKWDRELNFPRLAPDKRTVEFDVRLAEPNEEQVTFKELSGTLEYFTATTSKKLDSGIIDFAPGTEGERAGFSIEKIGAPEWDPNSITMELNVDLPLGAVKSSGIYTESGGRLDVSHGKSWSGDRLTGLLFSLDKKFPPRGRIVLEIYEDVKKHEIQFTFTGKGYLEKDSKPSSVGRPAGGSRTRGLRR